MNNEELFLMTLGQFLNTSAKLSLNEIARIFKANPHAKDALKLFVETVGDLIMEEK